MKQRRVFFMLLAGVLVALAAGVLVTNLSSAGYIIGGATKSIPNIGFHLVQGNPPLSAGDIMFYNGACIYWPPGMGNPIFYENPTWTFARDGTTSIWCGPYNIYTTYKGQENYFWGTNGSNKGGTATTFLVK